MKFRYPVFLMVITLIFAVSCSSSPEDLVKKGRLEIDSSTTIENALNGYEYFTNTKWSSFNDKQKRTIVEFVGDIDIARIAKDTINDQYIYGLTGNGMGLFTGYQGKMKERIQDKQSFLYTDKCRLIIQFTIKENDNFAISYVGRQINDEKSESVQMSVVESIYKGDNFADAWPAGLLFSYEEAKREKY